MPFLLAEILNFQGSTHLIGVGSLSYYHVKALRKKACEIPETSVAATQKQEVVQIPLWETESHPDTVPVSSPSVCLEMQGIRIEIHEQAGADVIRNTLLALRQLC